MSEAAPIMAGKLGNIRRKAVTLSGELATVEPFEQGRYFPVLIRPSKPGVNLQSWARENQSRIEDLLTRHGAILFRGFALPETDGLAGFTAAISMKPVDYMEGATPRKALGNNVFTSTEFPNRYPIALHNENSYVTTWPMRVCFNCVVPPEEEGETPIADVRRVLARIDPEIRARFEAKGYLLVRNFTENFGLPWRTSFHVETPEELEEYCRKARVEFEWCGDDRLRTRQHRPAVATHPFTREQVWFNHIAFWHVSSLQPEFREALLAEYAEDEIPFNTYYGDGSPIEYEVAEHLRGAYAAETLKFPWLQDDILLLDNMLAAHGRSPYRGARKIVVVLGNPSAPPAY